MDPLFGLLLAILHVLQSLQALSTIHGRVTFGDVDAPAPNMAVTCATRDRSAVRDTTTDGEGRYRCVVPPGIYRVSARVPRDEIRYLSQVFGATDADAEGQYLRVQARTALEVDFALNAAGSISGRVLDPDGAPIRNAVVVVSRETDDGEIVPGRESRGISVGESASFSIGGLRSGLYHVSVEPPERGNGPDNDGRRFVRTWYPRATAPQNALPLRIAEGSDVGGLDLTPVRAKPIRIAGQVLRADGSARGSGRVALVSRAGATVSTESATVDVDGAFSLTSVLPGEYELLAIAPGAPFESAHARLIVEDSDITDLRLTLRSASVAGRVRFEGGEFPRASLGIATRSDPQRGGTTSRTNDRWEFDLPGLSGPQLIRVTDLPPDWWLKTVTAAGRDITNYAMELGSGLSDVEIVVSREMSVVRGVVRSPDGDVPPDCAVVIFSDNPNEWQPFATTLRRVWPSADGGFVVAGLPSGRYNIVAVTGMPSRVEQHPARVLGSLQGLSSPMVVGDHSSLEVALTVRSYRQ
jgi:hypothetical protein